MKHLLRKPSTSHALSVFQKAVDELDAVVTNENAEATALDAKIAGLIEQQTAAKERAAEADKAAKRIRKLVA